MATFSTVTSTRSGGTVATMSWASRVVPSSIRSTRSSVGGTTGQAVGPAAGEDRLELVLQLGELDAAGVQPAALEAHAQLVDEVGIDAQRAAPRAHHRQLGAEVGDAR